MLERKRFTPVMLGVVVVSFAIMGVLSFNILRGAGFGVVVDAAQLVEGSGDYAVVDEPSSLNGQAVRFGASQQVPDNQEAQVTTPPSLDGFPTASQVGTSEEPANTGGDQIIEQPGTTLNDIVVQGQVQVLANDVTIRNVRIEASSIVGLVIGDGVTGTTIENVEVTGANACNSGISGGNFVARNVLVTGCQSGIEISEGTTTITRSVFSGLSGVGASAVRVLGGNNHVISDSRCQLEGSDSSCVSISPSRSNIDGVQLTNTYLRASGVAVELLDAGGEFVASNITVRDNVLSDEPRLPLSNAAELFVRSNNVYEDGQIHPGVD